MKTYQPNAFEEAAKWCLEEGRTPNCTFWFDGELDQAVLEGCAVHSVYEHHGLEHGEMLLELRRPFGDRELIRAGADGWRA